MTIRTAPAIFLLVYLVPLMTLTGCNAEPEQEPSGTDGLPEAQESFWESLQDLCGQAFAGELVRYDEEADAGWLGVDVTMHVRQCDDDEIRIPLHVGENRSRTWVLTWTERGIQLKHDHRHENGSEDVMTQYGGHTEDDGTANRQEFPADDFSQELFEREDHPDGIHNVWAMEIHPGERFTYELTRPGREFQANFDLTEPVEPPPAPWGYEDTTPTHPANGE